MGGPRAAYAERFAHHEALREAAARRSVRLSNIRAVTFLMAAGAWLTFDVMPSPASTITVGVAILLTCAFLGQVVIHRRVRRTERWEGALAGIAREGLLRLDRDWARLEEALPERERAVAAPAHGHPYAEDLNVQGGASLTRLGGPVTSERGRAILRGWLLDGDDASAILARQGAVRELAPMHELRAEFTGLGRLEGPKTLAGLGRFFAWSEGREEPPALGARLAAWLLPPLLVTGLVGYFGFGWWPWWIAPAVAHFWVLKSHAPRTRRAFGESVLGGPPLKALVPQLALLEGREWSDPLLVSVGLRMGRGEDSALGHLARLSRLLDSVESRRNFFYAVAAPLLLLDLHLWIGLERWREAHGEAAREWLEALGEWEALAAVATMAHDHPDWAFPRIDSGGTIELVGTGLGHPLLRPERCVRNDVSVGPPGTFLFVTGSNMSGKSTLLRALGANAVLAMAGAPVCAEALTIPPLRVQTSMRVEDSLEEGISLFMAELLRIKQVVDAAGSAAEGHPPVLYLLDEILHGTNTAERRIAARGVLRHLLASGSIGAVSTHDLALAEAADLQSAAHAVHFREEIDSGDGAEPGAMLAFDYKLREGVATTRNALKLLEAVGLGGLELEES